MKKLDLIIDFNNMFMRSLHTCQYLNTGVTISNFDTDVECNALVQKIMIDLSYLVRLFSPDRTIIVCDSKKPWRQEIYKEIPGEKYKGTREKDKNKNWDKIFATYSEVEGILDARNFIVTKIDSLEADDLATLWKGKLSDYGDDIIMVSTDKDWHQLIDFNTKSHQFCICYNPVANNLGRKKLYMKQSMLDWLMGEDTVDIFFSNYSAIKKKINELNKVDSKMTFECIDPDKVLLEKIMCGDDGDNIPAFYDYFRNGKKVRITPLKCTHILESLDVHNVNQLVSVTNDDKLKEAVEKEMKKEVDLDFVKRLDRQRRLVELVSTFFPENAVQKFEKHVNDTSNKGEIPNNIKMDTLLEGTKFIDMEVVKSKARESSIFDDIKTLSKFSRPLF